MANGRCHYHGGAVAVKHGKYTKQAIRARRETRQTIQAHRDMLKTLTTETAVHR